jgi:hypothetical protein
MGNKKKKKDQANIGKPPAEPFLMRTTAMPSTISSTTTENPNMEIHHSVKTPRQKMTHYLFEFLMLFLAVMAGFFSENLREHRIEHKRERDLMNVFRSDLKADIFQIDSLIKRRIIRNNDCDSLINLLTTANKTKGSEIYYYARNASRRIHFRPQDGALQQIRGAGGFRVVHDTAVLNRINLYGNDLQTNFENIDVEEKELSSYTEFVPKLFDVKVFQEMMKNNSIIAPPGNPSLRSYDPDLLNELAMKLHYWKRTSLSALDRLYGLKGNAEKLARLIKKEYSLK